MNTRQPSGHHPTDDSPERKPSLLDDLFSDPAKRAKDVQRSRVDEELSRPPSLVEDVFSSEPHQARKRFPVWVFVLGAILLTVVGSWLVFRSNEADPPVWQEDPLPKLEMATPPPVPPEPGEGEEGAVPGVTKSPEPAAKAAVSQEAREVPPVSKPPVGTRQPVTVPLKPAENAKRSEAVKAVNPPPSPQTETTAGPKPKLLREPEDLAKEQRAFDVLRDKSQAARQLLDGSLEQYRFLQYEVIPKDAGQYWVDLVAEQKGAGTAVHFIWAVDPDKRVTRALSQAARDIDH